MQTDLDQLQVSHSNLDVRSEWAKAEAKYGAGNVGLGWFRQAWLPRAKPRPSTRKKANRKASVRNEVWATASAANPPADWPQWFESAYPGATVPGWSDAPIYYRQAYAVQKLQEEGRTTVGATSPPKESFTKRCALQGPQSPALSL